MTALVNVLLGVFLTWATCVTFHHFPMYEAEWGWWYIPQLVSVGSVWWFAFQFYNDHNFRQSLKFWKK